jgi:hypothetical protein
VFIRLTDVIIRSTDDSISTNDTSIFTRTRGPLNIKDQVGRSACKVVGPNK